MADPVSFAVSQVAQIGISYLYPTDGPRLKDLKVSASTYGAAIPWVFGLMRVPGNMIWSLPIKETKKKKFQSAIGKGGFYNDYTYTVTFAMGLCRGPVQAITRIWADGKLLYDTHGGADQSLGAIKAASENASTDLVVQAGKYKVRFYRGDEDQMPDSALIDDLGEDQTPAFRGLSYLVFDNIPIADFGNRIPQITCEVYVGAADVSVLGTPFTEGDGKPLDAGFAQGEVAADWDRGYLYVRESDRIRRIGLKTAVVDVSFDGSTFVFPNTNPGHDTPNLARLLCTGADGGLYVTHGPASAQMPLDRLDPYSYQSVGTFGASSDDTPAHTSTGFAAPVQAVTASTQGGDEHLLALSADGALGILRTRTMGYVWGAGEYLGGLSQPGLRASLVGASADTSGHPSFYAIWGAGVVTHLDGQTQTDVFTFPDAPSGVQGAVWDGAVPGVIAFYTSSQGAQIGKWSVDTGRLAWTLTVPALPEHMSGVSRVQGTQLAWVAQGVLYIIDTATGLFSQTDVDPAVDTTASDYQSKLGQPNWDAYLALYPDVSAGWPGPGVNSNWKTVEDYAKWQYYYYGQKEGRKLPLYGNNDGKGLDLPAPYEGADPAFQVFDSGRALLVSLGGALNGVIRAGTAGTGVTVGSIVGRLLEEGGLTADQYDVTALESISIRGYGWASGSDVKSIIDELRRLYLFDMSEIDGKLTGTLRADGTNAGAPVATISQAALGSSSDDSSDYWTETRTQESDLPYRVSLQYLNYLDDYQVSQAHSKRVANPAPTIFSRQQVAMEMNVVMTPTEAKTQAMMILYSQWGERTKHNTRLPWAYLTLDPGDLIEVDFNDGRQYIERIHQAEIGADFSISAETYGQDSGSYVGYAAVNGDGGGQGLSQSVPTPKVAVPFVINTPVLRDQDDSGGAYSLYYVGLGAGAPGKFLGAGLYRSLNNIDYALQTSNDNDVEWGVIVGDPLPPAYAGPFALDWRTRITLLPAMSPFSLEPISDEDLWNGANPILVGDEVIQFRDCVENEDGTWTLWNLLRGRRGTEYACKTHKVGERMVALSSATISVEGDTLDSRGKPRFVKAVGFGRTLADTSALQITYEPRDLMPYAVDQITRTPPVAGKDITLSWVRRTRLGGNLQDGTGDVALSETSEAYEVYVLSAPFAGDLSRGAAPATWRRMYTCATPTTLYPAADQAADGFDPTSDTLHVAIYQLSGVVGRGFPGVRSIDPKDLG